MRIGLDAMGGDFAPESAVKGAIMALAELDAESRIVLYGDEARIRTILEVEQCESSKIEIVATSEVIEMCEHPVRAFHQKSDSSISVGFRHLAEGTIDGFASAGSTGAVMVGSTQVVRAIEGVIRPTIATVVKTATGAPVVLLDVGLNVDCKPEVLEQYALIGSTYAKSLLGIENPRVALLNIGEESTKGDLNTKATYELIQVNSEAGRYNFVGNVEASSIFTSKIADVVVCDGFVGNVVLKLAEGFYEINKSVGVSNTFWEGMNYEKAGGIPVLGVNATVIIGHGKSTPLAIKNMLLATEHSIRSALVERLCEAFCK